MKHFYKINKYVAPYKGKMILGIVAIIAANVLTALVPILTKRIFDDIDRGSMTMPALYVMVAVIILIAVVSGLMQILSRLLIMGASRRVETALRNDTFANIQKQSPSFFVKYRTGDIMSRLTGDIESVRMAIGFGVTFIINSFVAFVISIGGMSYVNTRLAIISLAPLIIIIFIVRKLAALMHEYSMKTQIQLAAISSRAQENFSGAKVIKAFTQENSEIEHMKKLNLDYLNCNMELVKVTGIGFTVLALVTEIGIGVILWFGGRDVISGSLSKGDFIAFNMFYFAMLWPMVALGWTTSLFQRANTAMERICELLEAAPEIPESSGDAATQCPVLKGDIEFNGLDFEYSSGQSSFKLQNISFAVPHGRTLAIIGTTGSGKTTLMNLLSRLVKAPDNSILIDGIDINKINPGALRDCLGVVPQESFLFSDTIRNNLIFGRPDASDEEMRFAARISRISVDIEAFPEKYGQVVGERGITLSGGQRQRIAIARAIMKNPRILVLDDALSSVDTHTEEEILNGLREFMKGRTCIMIAHRISTIKDADEILVLDNGRIVEKGPHQYLLSLGGMYAQMFAQQQLEQQLI
ncbi:MAG: ABC transporter ATP-binding protein [Planctomycetes bacterium]|nr:ABC transporter ATP-binding protein [Planctomycetota bacterium]